MPIPAGLRSPARRAIRAVQVAIPCFAIGTPTNDGAPVMAGSVGYGSLLPTS
jgi:hypothetical protein